MQANLPIKMAFREATLQDIPQIQIVRHAVKENVLSNPGLVTDKDCANYLVNRGKGWVCEVEGEIVGFAIADLKDDSIWALFVHPLYERKGVGKQLHELMLDWYFSNGKSKIWLGTSANTRAVSFYKKAGWLETGILGTGEIKFEMRSEDWFMMRCNSDLL
jgi:GNAT superfamily N-acetyltransferase